MAVCGDSSLNAINLRASLLFINMLEKPFKIDKYITVGFTFSGHDYVLIISFLEENYP